MPTVRPGPPPVDPMIPRITISQRDDAEVLLAAMTLHMQTRITEYTVLARQSGADQWELTSQATEELTRILGLIQEIKTGLMPEDESEDG